MNRLLYCRTFIRVSPSVKHFRSTIHRGQQKAIDKQYTDADVDAARSFAGVESSPPLPRGPIGGLQAETVQNKLHPVDTFRPFTAISPNVAPIPSEAAEIVTMDGISKDLELQRAAPFDEVPGPEFLKRFAKMWNYIPLVGNHMTARTLQYVLSAGKVFGSQLSWGNNMTFFRYLLNEYGPIVRLRGPFGGDVVIVSRPEHAIQVFESDGPHPVRSSLDCIEKYRLQHRKSSNSGPYSMSGPEWEVYRRNIESMLKQTIATQCIRVSEAAENFVERIIAIRNQQLEVPKSFFTELQKWSLECLCSAAFNKSFGFLNARGLISNSENTVLLEAINDATNAIKRCEFGIHFWKLFETPAWKSLTTHCDTIEHILGSYLCQVEKQLRNHTENELENELKGNASNVSMVEYFLLQDKMSRDDILTILLDMTILGINMSAHSAGFLLYYLSKNQKVQLQLYNDMKHLPEEVAMEDLRAVPYLKACLYESLRLKPPMPVLNRILNKDVIIYGYKIPKGTYILIATNLSSLREEHFEDALKYQPERWLGLDNSQDVARLATMPFGFGPRDCMAKDLAETQLYYLIFKVIRKFKIEYHYGAIDSSNRLLSTPNRPLKLRFIERHAI